MQWIEWMLSQFQIYFSYPFVRYAMAAGILIALSSSLLGVVLVLRRYSYIGDSLSHVAFGAMAVSSVLNLAGQKLLLILPVTILSAMLILRNRQSSKISGDAVLAMISVSSLALGYLIMNLFPVSGNLSGDVCSTLFGSTSILTLTHGEVIACAIFSGLVMVIYVVSYREIFRITFDEEFAEATGTRVSSLNTFLAGIIAVAVVLAMELVGSLLISALVIFPAVTSMQIFSDFRRVSIFSAVIGALGTAAGILIAILAGTPVGSTIVAADLMIFVIVLIGGRKKS